MEEIVIKAVPQATLCNLDNYQVVVYKNSDTGEKFTAVGSKLCISCECVLHGHMVTHKSYGKQLKVSFYEEIPPDSPEKIKEYLTYSKIKGIGKVMAARIVKQFGTDTFSALENPELLAKVKGISLAKAESICESYAEKKVMQSYFELLSGLGINISKTPKVYKKFSQIENGLDLIKNRPYLLCCCEGISFPAIDQNLISKKNFNPYAYDRVRFGIMHALNLNESNGHVFITKDLLVDLCMKLLWIKGVDRGYMYGAVEQMANQLVKEGKIIYSLGVLYRTALYEAESGTAEQFLKLLRAKAKDEIGEEQAYKTVKEIQRKLGVSLSEKQEEGIICALTQNVCIITGGPGTGKTTMLRIFIESEEMLRSDNQVVLCAPTGRAARKMEENAGRYASTVHHLLGLRQEETSQEKLEDVEADVLIMDETSMCSMELMYSLVSHIRIGTRVILIGDKDQLSSVKSGNVFSDLIASGIIPVIVLDKTFRQAEGNSIIENSKKINTSQFPLIWDESSHLIECSDEKECLKRIEEFVNYLHASGIEFADIQVITPFRKKTELGALELNKYLQDIFNPSSIDKIELKNGSRVFREGDRIMHLVNEEDVNNGDIGEIIKILPQERQVIVHFETGIEKIYDHTEFANIEHAFALTIHKSQGSEYPYVIIPFFSIFGRMRQRNLLYTAVTRAKNGLCIVGNVESIVYASNNIGEVRNSFLAYRMVLLDKPESRKK